MRRATLMHSAFGQNPTFGLGMNRAAYGWRDLAERRRAHFVELFVSGRWRHYYTDRAFFVALREAAEAADRWAMLAPSPDDHPKDDDPDSRRGPDELSQMTAA